MFWLFLLNFEAISGKIVRMYNWSVDEEKFKKVKDAIRFLKCQPEVIRVKSFVTNKRGVLLKVKLSLDIHPARKVTIAKMLQDKSDQLALSVVEG